MQKFQHKSNGKVSGYPTSYYAQTRLQGGGASALRDSGGTPPEKWLQVVWQHQRLLRNQLKTFDGQAVRILHPGFLSREGGPDFRGAVIQFGGATPIAGDVEIDLRPGGWRAHGHDKNDAFANVILHVVWEGGGSSENLPPRLAIKNQLDAPVSELRLWLDTEAAGILPENLRGQCSAPLRELPPGKLDILLRQAAQIRFQSKAAQFAARARQAGWEQTFWENMFRALGYKNNSWPMQCLAEQRPRWFTPRLDALALQARLLGIGNLLPGELTRAQAGADGYLRQAWDRWWREREEFASGILPKTLWRFHGQRPANHPQRRLALAAHWLADRDLIARIENWCVADEGPESAAASLQKILQVTKDDFWSWHWTLRSPRLEKSQPLLGAARVTDLAINVILPWLWARAREGGSVKILKKLEDLFNAWPAAEDNAVLRLARQRLLGGVAQPILRTASRQQGLMQIVRDFCNRSNSLCGQCRFPEVIRNFKDDFVILDDLR